MQATTDWSKNVRVEVRGDDVVGHAGNVIPRLLADNLGLTSGLSSVLSRPEVTHDRGAVLRDVAVSIAGGAQNLAGTAVLRDQHRLFQAVASVPAMWRSLGEIDEQSITEVTAVRNKVRSRVWEAIEARHGAIPASQTCYGDLGDTIVIRIDASLIQSHSDKQHAAGNFKGGFGFHPLLAWCDNTGELLAVIARAGNAGSNTAADHIAIIDAAIAAIPAKWRRKLLVTIDGAGSSHAVVEHLEKLNARPGMSVGYSVGFDLDERVRVAIGQMPDAGWQAALDATGAARDDAQVAELTGLLRHSTGGDRLVGWPAGMRILVRREEIEHGTQLSLFEQLAGYRYQVLATSTAGGQPQRLEARHRVHARVEGFIRTGKDTGLARWPSHSFAINTAWVTAVAIAIDLLCWMRLLLLDGPLAKAEPATLRYRLLHAAARLIKRSRYLILRIPQTWPWAQEFADALNRVRAIP
ncbi:IS1380 family transposase [Mycobacterium servetii]|uniref:IS1380 family transposase n=1 Tax=Mycobacterium servetii TaxID=3237418 RepID=A0ABV4BUD3_9MYCO